MVAEGHVEGDPAQPVAEDDTRMAGHATRFSLKKPIRRCLIVWSALHGCNVSLTKRRSRGPCLLRSFSIEDLMQDVNFVGVR
jgi:hypothetical protein